MEFNILPDVGGQEDHCLLVKVIVIILTVS